MAEMSEAESVTRERGYWDERRRHGAGVVRERSGAPRSGRASPRSGGRSACVVLNQLREGSLGTDRVEVGVLGSKRTERFLALDREPEMPDCIVCPTGEALAACKVVERPGVLGMSLDQLAPLIGGLGVPAGLVEMVERHPDLAALRLVGFPWSSADCKDR